MRGLLTSAAGAWAASDSGYVNPGATGSGDHVDDVWVSDLNGDGADEVIVGYNGASGLHVLNGDGQLLWKSTDVGSGNAWHVSAGDVWGEGRPQVVSTRVDQRMVAIDSSDGATRTSVAAGHEAFMVRVGKLSEKDRAAALSRVTNARSASGMPTPSRCVRPSRSPRVKRSCALA